MQRIATVPRAAGPAAQEVLLPLVPKLNRSRKFQWWKLRVGQSITLIVGESGVELGRARSLLLRSAAVYRMNHDPKFIVETRRIKNGIEAVRVK